MCIPTRRELRRNGSSTGNELQEVSQALLKAPPGLLTIQVIAADAVQLKSDFQYVCFSMVLDFHDGWNDQKGISSKTL